MSNESPSTEKTEQELFDLASQALEEGKDVGEALKGFTVAEPGTTPEEDEPTIEDNTPAEEPEVLDEEADGTGNPNGGTVPASQTPPAESPEDRIKRLEQERAQFEHRVRSDAGRVAALQRKVDDLLRAQAPPPTKQPAVQEPSVATKTKYDELRAKAKELDPDLVDLLDAYRDDVTEKASALVTNKVSQTEEFLRQREEQETFNREKARLLALVPEADEVFRNPAWRQWKDSQPPEVYALANSLNADVMYLAMQKFAADMQRDYPDLYPQQPQGVGTSASPAASKVATDRARKLASSAPAPTGIAAKQGKAGPQTDEELFAYVNKQLSEGKPIKF
jgi:hypothetical protein